MKHKGYTCYGCGARTLHQKVKWYEGHPYCRYCYRHLEKFGIEDRILSKLELQKKRYISKYKSSRRGKG